MCERFRVLPPGMKADFDSNDSWIVALWFAYEQLRQTEEAEDAAARYKG